VHAPYHIAEAMRFAWGQGDLDTAPREWFPRHSPGKFLKFYVPMCAFYMPVYGIPTLGWSYSDSIIIIIIN